MTPRSPHAVDVRRRAGWLPDHQDDLSPGSPDSPELRGHEKARHEDSTDYDEELA